MNILVIVLLVLMGMIVMLLIITIFMKQEHCVKREIVINTSTQKVFDYLKLLKNQDNFNQKAP